MQEHNFKAVELQCILIHSSHFQRIGARISTASSNVVFSTVQFVLLWLSDVGCTGQKLEYRCLQFDPRLPRRLCGSCSASRAGHGLNVRIPSATLLACLVRKRLMIVC